MPFCYETLVDSGEADYVYFGSFVRPASKDIFIVKESKLIIYTFTQRNTEVLFNNDLNLTKKLGKLSENGLVEHVYEYPFFGCVLSCCPLKQLIYSHSDHNESYVSTGSKRKKLTRSALSGYIDGIVLLMDDGNLLICYFDLKEFDFKLVSSYTSRGYYSDFAENSGNSLGNKFNISANKEDNRVNTFKNATESVSNKFKELPGNTLPKPQVKNENGEDVKLLKDDSELNYDTHMIVYENKWEINNQINNEKVYSKNYLLVFTRKQTEVNFLVLQSMYSSVCGGSVTVDQVGTTGTKASGDSGSDHNTNGGISGGVSVTNGAGNTNTTSTSTNATDTGPKLLLSGQSSFDINGKFNLSNSFVKNVTFIDGYYMPIIGLLITSYPEKIGTSAYNCYSGLSKGTNLSKKGLKEGSKEESVVSCSLLVLNVDLLTLNISIINRIDDLFIDTIGIRGFCQDDFVGFICHNNDYLLWFKLFNSSVYYQLMNLYSLFHPCLLHLSNRNDKFSRDKLINNMNLNVELSDYRMEVIDSKFRGWDGIVEEFDGRKDVDGVSQEVADKVDLKDNKFVLLLPTVSGKRVYYGRLVYRNGTIVNIEWSVVSVSSHGNCVPEEHVYGNHFDVLPISESDLFMVTTSTNNLMQMLVLSRPITTTGTATTTAAKSGTTTTTTITAKSGTATTTSTTSGARTKNGKRSKNEAVSSGAVAGDSKDVVGKSVVGNNVDSGIEESCTNDSESGLELTITDIPVTIKFESNNANKHTRSEVSLLCLLNVKSVGFLKSLNNFKYNPWMEVDMSNQLDGRGAMMESYTGGLQRSERSGGELNYVVGIRNDKEIVEMVRRPLYYLQAVLVGEGHGEGLALSVTDSSETSKDCKLVYGKHAVKLNKKDLHINSITVSSVTSVTNTNGVTSAAEKHDEQLVLTFVNSGTVYRVYSNGVLVGEGSERVPIFDTTDVKIVRCENVKNHLVVLTSDNKLHSMVVTDGLGTSSKSKSEVTTTKSGSRKPSKTSKARKVDTEKGENKSVKVIENVKAFNKVAGNGSYVSFMTVEDHIYLYNLETNECVFYLEGLHELNRTLRISYCNGNDRVSDNSNTSKTNSGKGSSSSSSKSASSKSNKDSKNKVGKGSGTNSKRASASISGSVNVNGSASINGSINGKGNGNVATATTANSTNNTTTTTTANSTNNTTNTTSATNNGSGSECAGFKKGQEEIVMCYLTTIEDCLYLVLLISGHCIYVYKQFGQVFQLVKHKNVQPYPSLLLCESMPEDESGESSTVYKLVPSVREHRVHSGELVTYPMVDVDNSQIVKFSRGGNLDKGGASKVYLKEMELSEEEREVVVEKFKARFEGFKWEIYILKSSQKRLFMYSIQLVGVGNKLDIRGSSRGGKEVKNNKDIMCTDVNLCTDEVYLDERALYLLSKHDNRLYIYEMEDYFDYYYGEFNQEVYDGLRIKYDSRLNVLYNRSNTADTTNSINNNSNSSSSNNNNGTGDATDASGSTEGTGDNYILSDNYYAKTFNVYKGLRKAFQTVNLMSVSSRHYKYNKENNTIREVTHLGFSEHTAHSGLGVNMVGSGGLSGSNEALGKLIALVVTVRENSLENYYNLLNTRNKLQLIHIDKEATKLDKLSINKHLKVHIQFYQALTSMSTNDKANGGVVGSGKSNGTLLELEGDDMIVTQDYVVLLHSSDMENILSYYKLETFESVLSIKFGQIYDRELILVGTNTNLGEYIESKGDVLILDFLHVDPLTLHQASIGGNKRSHSSQYNALDGEQVFWQNQKGPLRKMTLSYKKSFLYPVTYVSTLESEMNVPFSPEYFTSVDDDYDGGSSGSGERDDNDLEGSGGLSSGNAENAQVDENNTPARSSASNRLKDEQWLRSQFTDEINHIVHSVGSNIYIHEMKKVHSNQMIVRGAFNDLFTSISTISVFNKFLLIGDVLKGLSFFMYIYDSSNDSKNIIRIASTNPKINLPILSCSPLINSTNLTLLASDDNGNLLQFVPSNNINTDKDKLIIIGGVKFNNNIAQMLKYHDDEQYSIMAVGSCGSVYKVSMSSEDRFNFVKKFENVYESHRKNNLNIKHSSHSDLNLTKQMLNLQESIPTASQSVVSLDLLRDFYHENAEFYRNFLAKLNLDPYSLYDLFNFVYEEFY
ncbi:hypothetical protein MACK_001108 [Theileria orientalis]|uniref:RSE1/DDB1/CPSF1 C-terminal domain-containing protein n=1 Tax=Theileria orientalis TaxID=68886 RepID=A0A976QVD7_THEOR|nr:hypothetical protein MACK_001108 [Theileria orientalis]